MRESRTCEAPLWVRRVHNTVLDTGHYPGNFLTLEIGPLVDI